MLDKVLLHGASLGDIYGALLVVFGEVVDATLIARRVILADILLNRERLLVLLLALGEAGGGEKGIFYMKNIKLIPGETPDTPDEDDFNPTLRFASTSDMHLFNRYQGSDPQEARLANVFKVSYRYAQQSAYNKLDAVLVAGDISEGDAGEFVMFKDIVDANIQEGTQLIAGMGNHDFRGGLEPSAWTEDAAKKRMEIEKALRDFGVQA